MQIRNFIVIGCTLFCNCLFSQQMIDRVVAAVGGNIILKSEVESQYNQYLGMGYKAGQQTYCTILEDLMYQKLLLAQAAHDSLKVTEAQVDQEIDRKLKHYIKQMGSVEKFEMYYGKSIEVFKSDIRERQREYLLSQRMQSKITGDISVSPEEVKAYYNSLAVDSIPLISSEIEIAQIVKKPTVNLELKEYARQKITEGRKKVVSGQISFCALAASMSDDPGSRNNCGDYKAIGPGQMAPEFEAVVFRLKQNEISEIFETDFGFHFAQMMERRGDEFDIRHILVAIPSDPKDMLKVKARLDSVRKLVMDTLKFCDAAAKYSDDKDTKNACGLLVNPQTGTTLFEMAFLGEIDPTIVFTLNGMKPGDISEPVLMASRDGKQAYRIIQLRKRTDPHRANLKDDFSKIQEAALAQKQQKIIKDWANKKMQTTYVTIIDEYKDCTFENNWAKAKRNK